MLQVVLLMMDIRKTLIKHKFSEEAIQAATSGTMKTFFPPQEDAIKAGALDNKNLLLAIPTAAGKTFIAELCMIKAVLQSSGRCLYIAPLKALASEKYQDFQKNTNPSASK